MKTNFIAKAIAIATIALSFNVIANAAAGNEPAAAEYSASTRYVLNENDYVKANTTDVWTVTLRAGETFIVEVKGDGDTDLDLYLYDENDNLIDKDIDDGDYCLCMVTPKWTGTFKVRVKNLGGVYNNYSIKVY